ncbi:MAG: endonuclease/exonuclease/phosphatase family protein [Planctomycetes bacterium]|nr:endonuclease/exonuclease/phosphatase family protein [Planctomycetota bacterium]
MSFVVARAAVGVVALGLAVRFTVRDGVRAAAPLYYATPPLLLALGAATALTVALLQRRRRLAMAAAAMGAVASVLVLGDVRHADATAHAAGPAPRPLRGLLWNVEHGIDGWDRVVAEARETDPDVVWIVEGPGRSGPGMRALRTAFPEHVIVSGGGHLHVLVRGAAELLGTRSLGVRGSRATLVRAEVLGRTFETFVCDVPSRPLLDRRPIVSALDAWAAERTGPVVIAGDFNTPTDSAAFDPWRARFGHAFETSGTGWAPTWPMPFPVLEIDHVWVSAEVNVTRCRHGLTTASDHRPVLFEFDIASE